MVKCHWQNSISFVISTVITQLYNYKYNFYFIFCSFALTFSHFPQRQKLPRFFNISRIFPQIFRYNVPLFTCSFHILMNSLISLTPTLQVGDFRSAEPWLSFDERNLPRPPIHWLRWAFPIRLQSQKYLTSLMESFLKTHGYQFLLPFLFLCIFVLKFEKCCPNSIENYVIYSLTWQ